MPRNISPTKPLNIEGQQGACEKVNTDLRIGSKLMFVVNVDWFFLSHRLPIALEAVRRGYRVHIVTGLTGRQVELSLHGLVVHPLELHRTNSDLGDVCRTMWQLWRIFRAESPDLVHLVTIKPVLFGGLISRLTGVPAVVAAVSGLGFVFSAKGFRASIRRWLVRGLYKVALRHHNLKVIFQNLDDQTTLGKVANLAAEKLVLIHGSGVDLTRYQVAPIPSGLPLVVLATRLLADKGVLEFVKAARLLKQCGCNAKFVLVGAVDMANPSSFKESEILAWVEEGVIEWWGFRADMPQVLAAAQVVVFPSYYGEGLPKVLIEAAACGRAIVTTDHPGCRDAINPGIEKTTIPKRYQYQSALSAEG